MVLSVILKHFNNLFWYKNNLWWTCRTYIFNDFILVCSRHLPAIFRKYKLCLPFRTYITSTSDNEQNVIWPPFRYAFNWPDRICLEDEYGQYTYRDIFNSGNQLAEQITKQLDGKVQERVTFLCPNNASYLVTQWACWISGQIGMFLYFCI